MGTERRVTVLVAEDSDDDYLITQEALQEAEAQGDTPPHLIRVRDGEELLAYLRTSPQPGIILLDLNMPRKDGREALAEIKADAKLKRIPVVVLTTSDSDTDIDSSYTLGASSYLNKPTSFQAFVDLVRNLGRYWFATVELPVTE